MRKPSSLRLICAGLLLLFLVLAALLVFKNAEELVAFKAELYYLLQAPSADSNTDFTDYPVLEPADGAWYQDTALIYHAAGGIDGLDYTNSREALEQCLSSGNRCIEIDFAWTSDGELVLMHSWESQWGSADAPSLAEFTDWKVYGKYTPMTAAELIPYLEAYPDLYVVVDTKEEDQTAVTEELVDLCGGKASLLDRLVIQLYGAGIKEQLLTVYPFPEENFLFTCYKFGAQFPNKIMQLCYDEQIPVVTVRYDSWEQETKDLFTEKGFLLYEHTVNRPDQARQALASGTHGLYTDFLTEADLDDPG